MDGVNERLLDELNAKDDLAIRLGDTLDVKASIGLVVITFLATQTAYFLDKHVSGAAHNMQIGSVVSLSVALIFALLELWPRTYMLPLPESSGISRAEQLRKHYAQYEDAPISAVVEQLTKDEIAWAKTRITANQKKNHRKSAWLSVSFYFTVGALILNLLTLFWAIQHPF